MSGVISVEMIRERQEQGTYIGWAASRYLDILARGDRDICAYCECVLSDRDRTIDHIQPKSAGGKNNLGNLCLACVPCNRLKGGMSAANFRVRRLMPKLPRDRMPPRTPQRKKKKAKLELAAWDEGHDAVRRRADRDFVAAHEVASRRAAGQTFHHAVMRRNGSDAVRGEERRDEVRRNWKGLPDP